MDTGFYTIKSILDRIKERYCTQITYNFEKVLLHLVVNTFHSNFGSSFRSLNNSLT